MWKPFRTNTIVGGPRHGYSLNSHDGSRFPSSGFAEYMDPSYESLFEAITGDAPEALTTDITTLDFLPKKRNSWSTFNYVEHYKRSLFIPAGGGAHDTWINPSDTAYGVWHNVNIPVLNYWTLNIFQTSFDPNLAWGPPLAPINGLVPLWEGSEGGVFKATGGLEGTALRAMLPGINPALSGINSIYELKDLKTIPHTLKKCQSAISNLDSLLHSAWSSAGSFVNFGKKTLKSLVQGSGDVYLQKKFNVQPMLQDIINLAGSVDAVRNKLNQLIAEANHPITHHWGRNIDGFGDRNDSVTSNCALQGPISPVTYQRLVTYSKRRFNATLECSYRMPEGSYQDLLVRGIKDYNGLNLSIQTIWNAIPWSFVVDWVVAIGPWLSQFTQRQLEVVTHISKFGYSVNVGRSVQLIHSHVGQVCRWEEESYYRTPSSAIGQLISSLQTSGLSPDELSLTSALVFTHKR